MQTFKEFEFLIIDDGSEDKTEEIVNTFKDNRIKYFKKINSGLSDSLNYGITKASYDLIARMDPDDIALPYRLTMQYNFLYYNPSIDVVSSWYSLFKNNTIFATIKTKEKSIDIKKSLSLYSEIAHPGVLYKKKKIIELGKYPDGIMEDYKLWLNGIKRLEFANINKVLTLVRVRSDSIFHNNILARNNLIYKMQEPFYSGHLNTYFNVLSNSEENKIRGWRELLYGSKRVARKYFLNSGKYSIHPKIIVAIMISFIPSGVLIYLLELRLPNRLEYLIHYFGNNNIELRKYLRKLLNKPPNSSNS